MKRLPYMEGDWFAVPLRGGGYAVGVIARASKQGKVLLGYFFRPRHKEVPPLGAVERLSWRDAILVQRFGDLSLIKGDWPIIGRSKTWSRNEWPSPPFMRRDPILGKLWKAVYPDDNPNALPEVSPLPLEEKGLPEDGVSGSGAIELMLTHLLRDQKEGHS